MNLPHPKATEFPEGAAPCGRERPGQQALARGERPVAPHRALVGDRTLASVRLLRQLDLRNDDRIVCALARELHALTQQLLQSWEVGVCDRQGRHENVAAAALAKLPGTNRSWAPVLWLE